MPVDTPALRAMRATVALENPCSCMDAIAASMSCWRRMGFIPLLGIGLSDLWSAQLIPFIGRPSNKKLDDPPASESRCYYKDIHREDKNDHQTQSLARPIGAGRQPYRDDGSSGGRRCPSLQEGALLGCGLDRHSGDDRCCECAAASAGL